MLIEKRVKLMTVRNDSRVRYMKYNLFLNIIETRKSLTRFFPVFKT